MRYIQAEEVKSIAFLLVAMLLYTFIYFIYDNRLLIRLYFGRKKSVVKMKGRGKEVIETRIRFVIQESPLDKKLYHLVEMNGQIYNLSKARVFGAIDYMPMRASLMFKNNELVAVALEDKKLYEELIDDFSKSFRRVFITTIGVLVLWKSLQLRM